MNTFEKDILGSVDIKRVEEEEFDNDVYKFKGENYTIIFLNGVNSDNNISTEKIMENRKIIIAENNGFEGVAVCNPKDKFNKRVGIRIAILKCYLSMKRVEFSKCLKEIQKYSFLLEKYNF